MQNTYGKLIKKIPQLPVLKNGKNLVPEFYISRYFSNFSVISGLLKELRPFMSSLYKFCEDVAELDILLALAQVSLNFITLYYRNFYT